MISLMKYRSVLVLIILAVFSITVPVGCGSSESSSKKPEADLSAQDNIPERFNLKNIYGKRYQWSQFAGKPLIINFWATWCGPCRAEIPAMKKLYSEFHPQGLEIVAISLDQKRTIEQVVPFIDKYQIPWVVLYADQKTVDEFSLGASIPETIFFDANGNETARLIGAQPESRFRREIEKLFPPQAVK